MKPQRTSKRPPPMAAALIGWLCPHGEREALLGDLHEEFGFLLERDPEKARRWFRTQVLISAVPLAWARATSSRALRATASWATGSLVAVSAALAFGLLLETGLDSHSTPPALLLTGVVTSCALVSSICAGCAMSWVHGVSNRLSLAAVALVILAPDLVHALFHSRATPAPWVVLPLVLALIATLWGLRLGSSLGARVEPA